MEQPDEIGAVNTPAYQLNRFLNQASHSLCLPAQRLSNYAWTFIEIVGRAIGSKSSTVATRSDPSTE